MEAFLAAVKRRLAQFRDRFKSLAEKDTSFSRKLLSSSLAFLLFFVLSLLGSIYATPFVALAVVTGVVATTLFAAHRQADAIYAAAHPTELPFKARTRDPLLPFENHPIMRSGNGIKGYGTMLATPTRQTPPGQEPASTEVTLTETTPLNLNRIG